MKLVFEGQKSGVYPFQTAAVKVVRTCHLAAVNVIPLFNLIFRCLAVLQVFLPRQHSGTSNEGDDYEQWLFDTRDHAFLCLFAISFPTQINVSMTPEESGGSAAANRIPALLLSSLISISCLCLLATQ